MEQSFPVDGVVAVQFSASHWGVKSTAATYFTSWSPEGCWVTRGCFQKIVVLFYEAQDHTQHADLSELNLHPILFKQLQNSIRTRKLSLKTTNYE